MNLGNTPEFCTWKHLLPVILVKILSLWNHVQPSDPVELQLNLGMCMFSKHPVMFHDRWNISKKETDLKFLGDKVYLLGNVVKPEIALYL